MKKLTRRQFVASTAIGSLAAGTAMAAKPKKLFSALAPDTIHDPVVPTGITHQYIHDRLYGAKADERGAIGGFHYADRFTAGDHHATTVDGLIQALSLAKAGEVIYIPADAVIDLTSLMHIEGTELTIPAGVTVASDRGHQGSEGALVCSDTLDTPVIFRALGSGVRITGLRVQGPTAGRHLEHHRRSFGPQGRGSAYYYQFPVSMGIISKHDGLRVDNCELAAFSQSAIRLDGGTGHHIHHNYIHHCQFNGLGYGITHLAASSLIEQNLFDHNRHSIAGTGSPGCSYIARNNVELGVSLSHCFDMHGGRDRQDGTNIAGTYIEIANNTFRAPQRAVVIRGEPEEACVVSGNWFAAHSDAVAAVRGYERTQVLDNLYGDPGNAVVK